MTAGHYHRDDPIYLNGVLAQTLQPKARPTEQQPKPAPAPSTAAPAPAASGPAAATWRLNCSNSQAGLDCRAIQSLFVKRTGQRYMAGRYDTKKPVMLIQVTLRTYLPRGCHSSSEGGREDASLP